MSLILHSSQITIDKFYENDHEGVKYSIDTGGSVKVNQLTIDDEVEDFEYVEVETEPKLQRVK